jgi:hypothetical protein
MECKKCNGSLRYEVFDHNHEIMMSVECWDCLSVIQEQDYLADLMSRLLRNASPEKLAILVAQFLVSAVAEQGDLNRIHEITNSKNLQDALILATMYSER